MQPELVIQQFINGVARRQRSECVIVALLAACSVALLGWLVIVAIDALFSLPFAARLGWFVLELLLIWSVAYKFLSESAKKETSLTRAASLAQAAAPTLSNELYAAIAALPAAGEAVALPDYLRRRLFERVAGLLNSVEAASIVQLTRVKHWGAISAALSLIVLLFALLLPNGFARAVERFIKLSRDNANAIGANSASAALPPTVLPVGIESLTVIYHYPPYAGLADVAQRDNGNLMALVGAKAEIQLTAKGQVSGIGLRVNGQESPSFTPIKEGQWRNEITIRQDGNYEIALLSTQNTTPIIFTIQALKDLPPEVHLSQPQSDLLYTAETRPPSVTIRYSLRDDYGIAQAQLKYIKTIGEGDSAQFENGSLPVKVAAAGEVNLNLQQLNLLPGNSLLYYIEARDRNNITGPGVGYSENLVIEIAKPEEEKIAVDELGPEELAKMMISQRMIIINTEKLHAQRSKVSREEYLERSNDIAAQQRAIKNRFTSFVENEGAGHAHAGEQGHEAERKEGVTLTAEEALERALEEVEERLNEQFKVHDHGIKEAPDGGRDTVKNTVLAIRAMWDAEAALALAETGNALPFENTALKHLKLAQSAIRYFSRVRVKTKPVDLKRRYAGDLSEIKIKLEKLALRTASEEEKQLRSILENLYEMLRAVDSKQPEFNSFAAKLEADANRLLGLQLPFAANLPQSAAKLKLIARQMLDKSELEKARALLSQTISELLAILESGAAKGALGESKNLTEPEHNIGRRYLEKLRREN